MDLSSYPKPRPQPTPTSQPFWDALRDERVVLQHCDACDGWVHYPRRRCPHCMSDQLVWEEIAGTGTVFTFTVTGSPTAPNFADEMPQVIAVVELDQGVHITGTLVDVEPDAIRIGMGVRPAFDHGEDGITLLRFTPG